MAEAVERQLENSLDEILYIKKAKLFKKHEINELIRKRRHHEYSLQKRNKRVLDYDSYITTEITILRLLRIRRQKTEDQRYVDKIERSIIARLVRLHRQLCYRFQSRIDLWMRFIKFSCMLGRHMSAVRLWNRVLQVHGRTDPRLWAAAASYHLHQNAKAKIRSSVKSTYKETDQLEEKQNKLQAELDALNRYVKKKDQNKIQSLMEELQQTCDQLSRATVSLTRQRRITTDRIYLNAIREARRLLTEGIALNPECDMLHLELIKLEAAAADFFKCRILPRMSTPLNEKEEKGEREKSDSEVRESNIDGKPKLNTDDAVQPMDLDKTDQTTSTESLKKRKRIPKHLARENKALLTEVTEDITFVASGGALNLVLRSVFDRWSDNQTMLQAVSEITSSLPQFVDKQTQKELGAKLQKLANEGPKMTKSSNQVVLTKSDETRVKLRDQITKLCQTMMSDSAVEALRLWDSWYATSGTGLDLFRMVDPKLDEAVGLLRTRLSIAMTQANWLPQTDTESSTSGDSNRIKKQDVIHRTRSWLDGLATSQWGEQSPDFWIQYLAFESECGDSSRLPAIGWRASKLLNPKAYKRFTHLLNAMDSGPEHCIA